MITVVAITALVILALLAILQLLLVFGAPLGHFAWGGRYEGVLPANMRVNSFFSIVIYGIIAYFVLAKLGVITVDDPYLSIGLWIFTVYFFAGIFMNAMSRSKYERFTMVPVSIVLTASFIVLAIL